MTLPIDSILQGGKYKILRFISAGGFGCTYEALHVLLKKRMAIKEFFVKDFCNRDATTSHVTVGTTSKVALVNKLKAKFIEEAQSVSMLKHHNIVNVHDVFEENGTAYYVMDYIDGMSLEEIIRKNGALSEGLAMKYILQISDALKYVHSKNRLHLDIKPGNIMVDKDDNAMLIDFGASKQYDEEAGENTSTLLGMSLGYAPLEQMGNNVVKFLPSTDIYALGATLYKLLTGATPPSASLLASGETTLKPLPSSVSNNVCNAVYKAMEINKTKRPQTVGEFIDILTTKTEHVEQKNKIFVEEKIEDDKTRVIVDEKKPEVKKKDRPKVESVVEEPEEKKSNTPLILGIVCAVVAVVVFFGVGQLVKSSGSDTKVEQQTTEVEATTADTEHVTGQNFKDIDGKEFTYTGEVKDGKPDGKGMGIYPYGNYTGEYKAGLRDGKGTFESKDGSNKFEGTFANDKYSDGKLTLASGDYFEGDFKDESPYNGKWYNKDGSVNSEVKAGE